MNILRPLAARIVGQSIRLFARAITAVRADWQGIEPIPRQRVYYSNHTSNGDMPIDLVGAAPALRRDVRPVAAADYWLKNKLRAFVGPEVFNCVLIDRRPEVDDKPMDKILAALDEGSSLIIFPEGNRNMTDADLLPFKAGLYNMGLARPDVDLVPTWVANLNTIMPKGEIIPLPLICTVTFGASVHVQNGESKEDFLARAAKALSDLKPEVAS
jgi:1-acyl-sn-glycerol-3-phosphate acyltransferase